MVQGHILHGRIYTVSVQLQMHPVILLISISPECLICFRGGAAGLRPSAGGDREESLSQPGDQPHHDNIQEQTSYYY